jgi:hypothetical protein
MFLPSIYVFIKLFLRCSIEFTQRFGTTWQIVPKRRCGFNTLRCIISLKITCIIYIAAETLNHAKFKIWSGNLWINVALYWLRVTYCREAFCMSFERRRVSIISFLFLDFPTSMCRCDKKSSLQISRHLWTLSKFEFSAAIVTVSSNTTRRKKKQI